jgi:cysteinyl-tRNA synthetase
MDIYLHNTLSGKKEIFKPLKEGEVSMYNCGPTVYNYAHIGNLRSYVFADTLRRMFEYNGYKVNQVINVTDIGHLSSDADDGEDKMTKALKREGKPLTLKAMREVADFYFEKFKEDLAALNIETPEHFPFASDHIEEDIELVQKLTDKGFTYATSDGIYFDTKKFPEYGKLGNIKESADEQSRIGENSEKKNYRDFAVWKFSGELGYDAPFGKGFPGWHIECSAMSVKYLGPEFDIHTGGIDHIPVHHNNEIAQSVCAGDPYARYWMHNAHLNIGEAKMGKSGENFITLETLREKNIDPLALRYVFLTARYSSPLQFSWETLEGAETSIKRLQSFLDNEDPFPNEENDSTAIESYKNTFIKFINDDIDTPKALALIWDMIKDQKIYRNNKHSLLLDFDKVLGLGLQKRNFAQIPEEVEHLLQERDMARADKDFAKSDELRKKIEDLGFEVKDTAEGSRVAPK